MTIISNSKQTEALRRLPPYVFAELDRLKSAARSRGATLVDLGIGSPDLPIGPAIIDALANAARDPSSHGYPPFRGVPRYFESIGRFMQSRFGASLTSFELRATAVPPVSRCNHSRSRLFTIESERN